MARLVLLGALAAVAGSASAAPLRHAPPPPQARGAPLLLQAGDGGSGGDTPVTRVVGLLQEMSKTLAKESGEDEALYKELACWCNNGDYEKTEAIKASSAKVEELRSSIEGLTARSAELLSNVKELEAELASDKQALAEATALRGKQLAEFHAMELDGTQALENLKAAIEVLAKHHGAPPESTVAGGAIFKKEQDSWSMLAVASEDFPWSAARAGAGGSRSLDDFMRRNGFDREGEAPEAEAASRKLAAPHKFLQQAGSGSGPGQPQAWSAQDALLVQRALQSASAFVQSRHAAEYRPAYQSRSGEIFGVLKQLEEEMEGNLGEAQKHEMARGAAFAELQAAKTSEVEDAEKMAERKEDELATTANELAEAKEDLGQEEKVLGGDQQFLGNLRGTCVEAEKNFGERKQARLAEMQAVSETIGILQGDEARDALSGTFKGLLQLGAAVARGGRARRCAAAETLRAAARRAHSPQLSILATSVELDAFTRVKKAIDDMISMLKLQQEDEVKKTDWCKVEIQENEMTTAKTEDRRADLEAKTAELASSIQALEAGISDAHAQIAQLQLELQRASEDRQRENLDFQKTVADQTTTVEVLKKALDRLATYYDLLQRRAHGGARQTPPVPQMEYKPSKSAGGVMQMIEKLVQDARALVADAKKSESDAQAAYEQTVADTNGSVAALQREIVAKTEAKGRATRDKLTAESDLVATVGELGGLSKYNGDLHGECDYALKNFDVRQAGRAEEVEALQQAKQILSGASLS